MKTIHKYILSQVLTATFCSVGVFVFLMITVNVMREELGHLADGSMGWDIFFWALLLLMPYVAAYALPLGLLMAILLVLGRLSAQREITGMRAVGLSITQISAPVILVALMGVAASLFINFYYSPIARTTQKANLQNLVRNDPLKLIQPRKFNKGLPGYVIYVTERDESNLTDLWVWELDKETRVVKFIRAETGVITYNRAKDAIVLKCYNGTAELRSESDPEDFLGTGLHTMHYDEWAVEFLLDEIFGNESVHRKLSMLTLGELLEFRQQAMLKSKRGDPEGEQQQFHAQMQIQANFANSFAALSLALIAIPLGIKVSRSETMANLALALALGLLYYLLMLLIGMLKGHPEWRPDLLIWVPNITFQALGIYMLRRLSVR